MRCWWNYVFHSGLNQETYKTAEVVHWKNRNTSILWKYVGNKFEVIHSNLLDISMVWKDSLWVLTSRWKVKPTMEVAKANFHSMEVPWYFHDFHAMEVFWKVSLPTSFHTLEVCWKWRIKTSMVWKFSLLTYFLTVEVAPAKWHVRSQNVRFFQWFLV
jgi:hypothetical protein